MNVPNGGNGISYAPSGLSRNGPHNPGPLAFTNAFAVGPQNQYPAMSYAGGFPPHQLSPHGQFSGPFSSQQYSQPIPGYMPNTPLHAAQQSQQPPASNAQSLHAQASSNSAFSGGSAVPFSHQDEKLLVKTLYVRLGTGKTRRQALESLHGVNSHTAGQWKDHYLEHGDRLDEQVAEFGVRASAGASSQRASGSSSQSRERSTKTPHISSPPHAQKARKEISEHPSPSSPLAKEKPSHTPRSARISRDVKPVKPPKSPRRRYRQISAPPDSEIPAPPSRSPSPPIADDDEDNVPHRYTKAEHAFFIASTQWQLRKDPTLSITRLLKVLAKKVPRHTANSWGSYLRDRRPLFDKLSSAATGEPTPTHSDSDETSDHDQDDDDDGDEDGSGDDPEGKVFAEEPDETGDELEDLSGSDEPLTEEDIPNMGLSGGPITDADKRMIAKHVASMPNWHTLSYGQKWTSFHMKYPQRSSKAWAECYRRNELAFAPLVRRYKRKFKGKSKASAQSDEVDERATSEPEDLDEAYTTPIKRKPEPGPEPEPAAKRRKENE
ncbi:hypothetical protein B0H21DRAFT_534454 [Amylocystis lapponica]|nr:hypothetical protein B0H21DRAFT_534454 [Amylocystis lapponica]